MSEPDSFEDDLLCALTRTGEGFRTEQTDRAALVAGGYRRGQFGAGEQGVDGVPGADPADRGQRGTAA
ncbi:hypothetical protein ABZW03_32915, partial [Kitasatospora sp. NPDC004799]|uniref:hypothetical protein n=1 Tax=Kitasatospora sp. NPDC004799 TaxID=3154460 RepID=UPI0033B416DB